MDFRFQEPDTDVEAAVYKVTARLEGHSSSHYVNESKFGGYWDLTSSLESTYVIERHPRLEAALDHARQRSCREVKAMVLSAEAQRIRQG